MAKIIQHPATDKAALEIINKITKKLKKLEEIQNLKR